MPSFADALQSLGSGAVPAVDRTGKTRDRAESEIHLDPRLTEKAKQAA
jgi:hypothetical protein